MAMAGVAAAGAEETPVQEELKRAAEKFEADFSKNETKIHRFPASLRGVTKEERYLVPSTVAIGPYHHHLPHLQEAEEVKRAAAYYFWRDMGDSVQADQSAEAAYQKILSVAGHTRSCYADDAVGEICEADFAAMMFRDGCFLLQFMVFIRSNPGEVVAPSLQGWFNSKLASILRDIFLLENQIPWMVLHALMAFKPVLVEDFISRASLGFEARLDLVRRPPILNGSNTPAHLLALLRYYQCGSIPRGRRALELPEGVTSLPQSSSAIELAEIGIQLVANDTSQLKDMGIFEGPLFGGIFLAPLVIDDLKACWLVNMVALEACSVSTPGLGDEDTVSSYVLLLAMLMNREEDVHELRAKGLVRGGFSDHETLEFFKNLVKQLFAGLDYFRILAELEAYRRKRRLLIPIHKFVYNNFKLIVTVFSIIGVLVGIFKALLSIKQRQQ